MSMGIKTVSTVLLLWCSYNSTCVVKQMIYIGSVALSHHRCACCTTEAAGRTVSVRKKSSARDCTCARVSSEDAVMSQTAADHMISASLTRSGFWDAEECPIIWCLLFPSSTATFSRWRVTGPSDRSLISPAQSSLSVRWDPVRRWGETQVPAHVLLKDVRSDVTFTWCRLNCCVLSSQKVTSASRLSKASVRTVRDNPSPFNEHEMIYTVGVQHWLWIHSVCVIVSRQENAAEFILKCRINGR